MYKLLYIDLKWLSTYKPNVPDVHNKILVTWSVTPNNFHIFLLRFFGHCTLFWQSSSPFDDCLSRKGKRWITTATPNLLMEKKDPTKLTNISEVHKSSFISNWKAFSIMILFIISYLCHLIFLIIRFSLINNCYWILNQLQIIECKFHIHF